MACRNGLHAAILESMNDSECVQGPIEGALNVDECKLTAGCVKQQ
jgi:hypothetical protein